MSARARRARALCAELALAATAEAHADPARDYLLHCQGCHRADGSGLAGEVPDLRGHVARYALLPLGREYLVRVPGSAQAPLDDAALAALLDWLVARFGAPEAAARARAFTATEVARWRGAPLADVAPMRAALLRELAGLQSSAGSDSGSR